MADQNPAAGQGGGGGLQPNVAGALCYLCGWLTGLIFLLIEKENKEVRYNAWQAIFLSIALIVCYVFLIIPFLGLLLFVAGWIGWLVVSIVSAVKAYQGQRFSVPLISDLAKKQIGEA